MADFVSKLKSYDPASIFLVIGLLAGVGYVTLTPPMQSPDEVEHFYRSYQVSDFNLVSDKVNAKGHGGVGEGYGGELPRSLIQAATILKGDVAGSARKFEYNAIGKAAALPLNVNDRQKIRFDNTTIYSPIPYIPQAIGINVGKAFNANPVVLSYLGRITNLLVWLFVLYLAIRITPIGKWAFTSIALSPLAVFLAANLSSDTFTIAIAALFVAIILKLRTMTRAPGWPILTLLGAVAVMICLLKNAYLPLVLLLFMIPSRVISIKLKIAAVVFGIGIGLLWNLLVFSAAKEIPEYFGIMSNIDARAQLSYMLQNPLVTVGNFAWNVFGTPSIALNQTYNGLIGWGDVPLPFWLTFASLLTIVLSLLYVEAKPSVVKKVQPVYVRLYFALVILACVGATVLSLYIGWTEVGNKLIGGVQGRYFIPVTFLLIPVVMHSALKIDATKKVFALTMVSMYTLTLVAALIILGMRYSGGIWW